jgi:hypothetical protein
MAVLRMRALTGRGPDLCRGQLQFSVRAAYDEDAGRGPKMAHTIALYEEDPAVKVGLGFGGFSDQGPRGCWSIRVAHEDIKVKA